MKMIEGAAILPETIETHLHHAMILQTTAAELKGRLTGEATSSDVIERLAFAGNALEHFAADLAVVPALLPEIRDDYRAAITAALAYTAEPESWRSALEAVPAEDGLGAQRELLALRDLAGRIIRELSDTGADRETAAHEAQLRLGRLDFDWLQRFEKAKAARAATKVEGEEGAEAAPDHGLTPEKVTAYLRRHFPNSPAIEAVRVSTVPGGRSKRTTAVTLANTDELPLDLIMRQDFILKYAGQSIRNEVTPLRKLADHGLPVPEPLHVELDETELGGPFFLTPRAKGAPAGTFFGPQLSAPGAVADVAVALAKLHSIPPEDIGLERPQGDPRSLVRDLIDRYWTIWRTNSTRGSAQVDYAYALARQLADLPHEGQPTLVHGDAGGYNWLVDEGRLSVILDWEFVHVGDPAEDLGVMRAFAEVAMPWSEFMTRYRDAGGPHVPEERIELANLLQWLKGTTLVATSARNFAEGGTADFIKATNSFVGLRMIEMKIVETLKRRMQAD
jgi:aminoglycoside phosphotransferase (APT) family kinase protein